MNKHLKRNNLYYHQLANIYLYLPKSPDFTVVLSVVTKVTQTSLLLSLAHLEHGDFFFSLMPTRIELTFGNQLHC